MLYDEINAQGNEILEVWNTGKIIFEKNSNVLIINARTYKRYIHSFSNTNKFYKYKEGDYVSSNDVYLPRGKKIKDISFTGDSLDWEALVIFSVQGLNQGKMFQAHKGITGSNKNDLINVFNSRVYSDRYFYFSEYNRDESSETVMNSYFSSYYNITLRIDYL